MQLTLNPSDGVPIYLQLVQQIKYLVAAGRLSVGDQLPSVRKLSDQLVINPNTVVKAYRELELMGVVTLKQGAGAFVADGAVPLSRRDAHQKFLTQFDNLLVSAVHLEMSQEDVLQLVRQRYRQAANTAASTPSP